MRTLLFFSCSSDFFLFYFPRAVDLSKREERLTLLLVFNGTTQTSVKRERMDESEKRGEKSDMLLSFSAHTSYLFYLSFFQYKNDTRIIFYFSNFLSLFLLSISLTFPWSFLKPFSDRHFPAWLLSIFSPVKLRSCADKAAASIKCGYPKKILNRKGSLTSHFLSLPFLSFFPEHKSIPQFSLPKNINEQ